MEYSVIKSLAEPNFHNLKIGERRQGTTLDNAVDALKSAIDDGSISPPERYNGRIIAWPTEDGNHYMAGIPLTKANREFRAATKPVLQGATLPWE